MLKRFGFLTMGLAGALALFQPAVAQARDRDGYGYHDRDDRWRDRGHHEREEWREHERREWRENGRFERRYDPRVSRYYGNGYYFDNRCPR